MELKRLRYLRAAEGLSQDQVASTANVSQAKISRAERGFAKLRPEEQKRIASIFGCKPGELFPEA